jgi:hypothetical protein
MKDGGVKFKRMVVVAAAVVAVVAVVVVVVVGGGGCCCCPHLLILVGKRWIWTRRCSGWLHPGGGAMAAAAQRAGRGEAAGLRTVRGTRARI